MNRKYTLMYPKSVSMQRISNLMEKKLLLMMI